MKKIAFHEPREYLGETQSCRNHAQAVADSSPRDLLWPTLPSAAPPLTTEEATDSLPIDHKGQCFHLTASRLVRLGRERPGITAEQKGDGHEPHHYPQQAGHPAPAARVPEQPH